MRIYSMTATFGKLEHETLKLEPGLNVICAGNEWGKSTWCAFLTAMLYGVETRAKSTRTALADKEHYAPWSGSPMEGRIDLNWNGRDITIERRTRGRVPMGEFRAYETASGVAVPELNAANCGQQLLGVERSVFVRSGYIRSDLSVSDDEALRRRLNSLVTTGDENSAADRLAKGLKDLKNRIRYNRTGLLPQAEAERARLEKICRDHEQLEGQGQQIELRLRELSRRQQDLENHADALAYADALEDQRKLTQAKQTRDRALEAMETASARCESLPGRETAEQVLAEIERLHSSQLALQERLRTLPAPEAPGPAPEIFEDMTGGEACDRAELDAARHRSLRRPLLLIPLIGILLILAGAVMTRWYRIPGFICAGAGILAAVAGLVVFLLLRRKASELEAFYGHSDPGEWIRMAENYAAELTRRRSSEETYIRQRGELEAQLHALSRHIDKATNSLGLAKCRADWQAVIAAWDSRGTAIGEYRRAEAHLKDLRSMVRVAQPPRYPDALTCSPAETQRLLAECRSQRQQLDNLRGQCQGHRAALEPRDQTEDKLNLTNARIRKLEQTYDALAIAQITLSEAAAELQRRFAPRISRRAQELMGLMTGGRYDRVNLGEDLTIRAGARQEDTLHEALWRSDGTVDQLYLALRLAVAEALLPGAPLILDDALVRFDDERLKAALEILKLEARDRQVILFTCHSRETNLI